MIDRSHKPNDAPLGIREISEIWKKHLEIEKLETSTSFEALGGHSLHAVRIVSEITRVFGLEPDRQQELLEFDTVEKQAVFIASLSRAFVDNEKLRSPFSPEEIIVELETIWKRNLHLEEIPHEAAFESFGGQSLQGTQILKEISEKFGLSDSDLERLREAVSLAEQVDFLRELNP